MLHCLHPLISGLVLSTFMQHHTPHTLSLAYSTPKLLCADPECLQQDGENLLSNAFMRGVVPCGQCGFNLAQNNDVKLSLS